METPTLTLHDELTALYLPQERRDDDKFRMLPAFDGSCEWHNISWLLDLNIWEDENEDYKAKAALYLVHEGSTLTENHIPIEVIDKRTKKEQAESASNIIDKVINQIKIDLDNGDATAVEELLLSTPKKNLLSYLPETNYES